MKVAVVFNEAYPEIYEGKPLKLESELAFETYFDLEGHDPITEYGLMADALKKEGYEAYTLNIKDDIHLFIQDIEKNKPDVIFNLVELYKEVPRLESSFTGLIELLGIPYTGANPSALSTCQNKTLTKRILSSIGIRTPNFRFIRSMNESFRLGLNIH